MSNNRQFFVGANWKLNPCSREEQKKLVSMLNNADFDSNTEVVVAPPTIYLIPVSESLKKGVKVSAQNSYVKTSGAFTGEVSASQLHEAGIPFVILGHSERRTLFHETSTLVAQKTRAALDAGLSVILCVGETLQEREAGETDNVVKAQLQEVVNLVKDEAEWSKIVVAYEPVWAIGTGKVATTQQAQETQKATRAYLASALSQNIANATRIIYGGSVNDKNCRELATQPDVDGFLVGGASLTPGFVNIVNAKRA